MNLLERVFTLLRANLSAVVEKSNDPEKTLQQLQLDMRNQLVQVKTQVATAIAESHRLRKRSQEKKAEADIWLEKAEQAVQQENDPAARTALMHYNDMSKQVQRYQQQQKEQEQLVVTMRNALRQLEAKISEVETTIDLLLTRKRNALIQQRVFDALNKTGKIQNKERTIKAQDAVLEAEARAQALADLHGRDLDTQLNQLSDEQTIEQQLHDLKARKHGISPQFLQLHEGRPQGSALLRPQPQSNAPIRKSKKHQRGEEAPSEAVPLTEGELERLKKLVDTSQSLPARDFND